MTSWHAIADHPIPEDELVIVGWWFEASGMGRSWEIDTDPETECATHWIVLPMPPREALA